MGWWHAYWAWTGGNIGAMPLEAAISVAVGLVLARPLRWAWHKVVGDDGADLDDLRRLAAAAEKRAAAAHQIAADLFEHHTGREHPAAPQRPGGRP